MNVTPEMARALQTLREAATHPSVGGSLRQAINTLDNAGVFAEIDAVTDELEIMFGHLADDHGEADEPTEGYGSEEFREEMRREERSGVLKDQEDDELPY